MQTQQDNRSLGELFSELTAEMTTLVRQEVALAKTEMSGKITKMRRDVIMIAAGAMLAWAGFLTLIATVILMLTQLAGMQAWLAALIVMVIVLGLGVAFLLYGVENLQHMNKLPTQTIETVKEDVQWAKEQAS
jgi:uncharacterized membrane protein YqjE